MTRIQFKPDAKSGEVEVANGDYRRVFRRAEQPFVVEDEHWPMLKRTGHFEAARLELPPAPNTAGQQ